MIRKARNFFLGLLSFIPVIALITSILLFGQWVSEGVSVYNMHINSFIPILIVQALNFVISSVVVVMMSLHAAKHTNMDRQQLVIWVLLLTFFSIIALPLYWVIYVKDDKEKKIVIKECTTKEKDNIDDIFVVNE